MITFACYGCRLHGDAAGSVDRWHNAPGTSAAIQYVVAGQGDAMSVFEAQEFWPSRDR